MYFLTACVVDTCRNIPLYYSTVDTGVSAIIVHLGKDGTAGVNDTDGQFATSANGTRSVHLDLLNFCEFEKDLNGFMKVGGPWSK
jgi:hypothetical protein